MDRIKIEPPMNPNAYEDFKKALEETKKNWHPQMFVMDEPKSRAVLAWRKNGAWQDFVAILLVNGYDVDIKHIPDGGRYSAEEIEVVWGDKLKGQDNEFV